MSIRPNAALAAAATAALLSLTACAGSGDATSTAADGAAVTSDSDTTASLIDAPAGTAASRFDTSTAHDQEAETSPSGDEAPQVAVISTGQVSLEADDVTAARRGVQQVIDRYRGTVSEEESTTDDDGVADSTRLVIRVPSTHFAQAMKELEKVADLRSSTSSAEDVTTQVIDNRVRLRAQEKSLERIEALLADAKDLREVIAIESQLTRRQADYDALKATQAWLADQTTLSTITLDVQRIDHHKKSEPADGFIGGLDRGWDGLVAALVGLGTLLGLVLPSAAVAALVGLTLWLALRGVRRRSRRL